MPLQLDELAALDAPSPTSSGQPLLLPVADIDEDPDQPRREFDANALQELAETIRERGVRQPISVRPNLQRSGRWVLNFGARRLRASKLAGLEIIPAFIDTTADSYDQVIENEQREGLKPLELALFVQKRLALGDKQAGIAKSLGKSRQWVTLVTALIEAPDWLLQAYREGRCRGMNELYELRRLHSEHAAAVEAWAAAEQAITRERIAALRAELALAADDDASGDAPSSYHQREPAPAFDGRSAPTRAVEAPMLARGPRSATGVQCVAIATQGPPMKTATFPSLRVEPELREAAESVLEEGETLSGFIEASVRETIERRRTRAEFIARGLVSRDEAKRTGVYFAADDVHAELGRMLAKAKVKLQKKARG